MSRATVGLLDTNVVVHSLTSDAHARECRAFLESVRVGRTTVVIDPLVVHELTYSLPRYVQQMNRADVAGVIESLLLMRGVEGDLDLIQRALALWKEPEGLGFVDCYLAIRARDEGLSVFTKNVRHMRRFGVQAQDPLPNETDSSFSGRSRN